MKRQRTKAALQLLFSKCFSFCKMDDFEAGWGCFSDQDCGIYDDEPGDFDYVYDDEAGDVDNFCEGDSVGSFELKICQGSDSDQEKNKEDDDSEDQDQDDDDDSEDQDDDDDDDEESSNGSETLSSSDEEVERSEKWIQHYSSSQRILLVGEGNYSFAVSLAKAFRSAHNIVATSLDSLG